jgi:gas vesicle protein
MNAMERVAQVLELGAELLGSATKRARDFSEIARDHARGVGDFASEQAEGLGETARDRAREFRKTARASSKDFGKAASDRVRDFGETANEVISELRDEAPKKAKKLRKKFQEQFEPEPSVGARVLPFFAGLSVGLGAALLFAPRSGREIRERITQKAKNINFPKTANVR